MTGGQISYDLRRLRAHQIIERIPHSRSYQVTADGLSTALFFTRLTRRVIIPGLADLAGCQPAARQPAAPGRPRLQGGDRRPRRPGLTRHPVTIRNQKPVTSATSRNTQPKLTRPLKSLRGKITYSTRPAQTCRHDHSRHTSPRSCLCRVFGTFYVRQTQQIGQVAGWYSGKGSCSLSGTATSTTASGTASSCTASTSSSPDEATSPAFDLAELAEHVSARAMGDTAWDGAVAEADLRGSAPRPDRARQCSRGRKTAATLGQPVLNPC